MSIGAPSALDDGRVHSRRLRATRGKPGAYAGMSVYLLLRFQFGVPDDFPDMIVRISEIAGVATEEAVAGGVGNGCSGPCSLGHDVVDFLFGTNIVRQHDPAGADLGKRNVGLRGEGFLWPERQNQPASQLEE